jgi:hypothetical protein
MSSPVPIFGSQNLRDDDGAVIDSFLIETDSPPNLKDMEQPIVVPPPIEIPRPTRIIAGTEIFTASTDQPRCVLVADSNRLQLTFMAYSQVATPTVTDYGIIADELAKTANIMATGTRRAYHLQVVDFSLHTGPVWIAPGPITGVLHVTWSAVTK